MKRAAKIQFRLKEALEATNLEALAICKHFLKNFSLKELEIK